MAYNLIVGWINGEMPGDRMLETSRQLYDISNPQMVLDLQRLPTLVMPEVGSDAEQLARVGTITDLRTVGSVWRYRFAENPAVRAIPSTLIEALAGALDIDSWDLTRSRWSLKQPDLYRALYEASQSRQPALVARPEAGRIAMMMPFTPAFDRVWETLKGLAAERGWVCARADTVWEHDRIMDDVLELITRAQVIVCDLSATTPTSCTKSVWPMG